jgi:hypothetical protein
MPAANSDIGGAVGQTLAASQALAGEPAAAGRGYRRRDRLVDRVREAQKRLRSAVRPRSAGRFEPPAPG